MMFYQDVIQVEPGMMADYLTALGEKAPPPLFKRGNRPAGMFRVVPGTGNCNGAIFINLIEIQRALDYRPANGRPN